MSDTLNGYDVEEYLGQVVNMSEPSVITGTKTVAGPVRAAGNVSIGSLHGSPLHLSSIMTVSGDQTITGNFKFDRLAADSIQVRAVNGRNLSDYVRVSGTDEVQVIHTNMSFESMTVKGPLTIESRTLNGCNLTEYLPMTRFTDFDSIVIANNGSLILEQPYDNNAILAALSVG